MNRCSDNLTGSPTFTVSTLKAEDGTYEARCDSIPELPPCKGEDEIEAIRAMRVALDKFIISGGVR